MHTANIRVTERAIIREMDADQLEEWYLNNMSNWDAFRLDDMYTANNVYRQLTGNNLICTMIDKGVENQRQVAVRIAKGPTLPTPSFTIVNDENTLF